MTYQEKVREVVDYVTKNLVAEVPRDVYDPERDITSALTDEGELEGDERFIPVTTTLLFLNSCMGNNTLLEGGSGTGKTRLASVVGSVLHQWPYEMFERRRIVGTPGATVNEIYATHDLAELNRGNDKAFLYLPFYAPVLLIDELNRYSELEQNKIREGIAANTWNYANHAWIVRNQMVISAINPESYGGTFILNENLLDNYSMVLEPAHYNPFFHEGLVKDADRKIKEMLGLEDAVDELMGFYEKHKNDSDMVAKKILEVQKKTHEEFRKRGIPMVFNGELGKVADEINSMEFTPEGTLFFHSVMAEMTYNQKYGRLRYDDPISDDHDSAYLSTKLKEGLSGRFLKDWLQASKAIAWYFGKEKVDTDEVRAAFVYTSNRRVKPEEDFYQEALNAPRQVPVNFKVAKNLMEVAWGNYSDFSKPENPAFQHVRSAIQIITGEKEGTLGDAVKTLKRTDHPMARCVLEALALHQLKAR